MSNEFDFLDDITRDNLYLSISGNEYSDATEDEKIAYQEVEEEVAEDFKENVVKLIPNLGEEDPSKTKEEIIKALDNIGAPKNIINTFKKDGFIGYLSLIFTKIIEYLEKSGLFSAFSPAQVQNIKKEINKSLNYDAKIFIETKGKQKYKAKMRSKKFAGKKDYEVEGKDNKYGLDDFPARYDAGFVNQFSQALFKVESANTAWGEWIENMSEKAGAIGPSQIMFFNFPKWMKDAGYDWSEYYGKMTEDQKTFWEKYENSSKGTYTSNPTGEAPATENDPTFKTVGSIMAAILRDVGATEGKVLKDMTFEKLNSYFDRFDDWGVVAGSWYCGPGYANSPKREDCKKYAEKVLANFLTALGKSANLEMRTLNKIANFSNKLDLNRLYTEASIIDEGLVKLSS